AQRVVVRFDRDGAARLDGAAHACHRGHEVALIAGQPTLFVVAHGNVILWSGSNCGGDCVRSMRWLSTPSTRRRTGYAPAGSAFGPAPRNVRSAVFAVRGSATSSRSPTM